MVFGGSDCDGGGVCVYIKCNGTLNKMKTEAKQNAIRNAKNFDELLNIKYGKVGAKKRDRFEKRALHFVSEELLKEKASEPLNELYKD